jgi:hypothetical protein
MCSFPRVDADAKIKPEKGKMETPKTNEELKEKEDDESSESESEVEGEGDDGKKKKRPKDKIGFRDRKVN